MDNFIKKVEKGMAINSYVKNCIQEFPPTYSHDNGRFSQVIPDSVSKKEIEAKMQYCEAAKQKLDKYPDVRVHKDSHHMVKGAIPKW